MTLLEFFFAHPCVITATDEYFSHQNKIFIFNLIIVDMIGCTTWWMMAANDPKLQTIKNQCKDFFKKYDRFNVKH